MARVRSLWWGISVLADQVEKAYTAVMTGKRTRRWGAGKAAATRLLYASRRPVTQVDLAAMVGVSQPAVSQYLTSLRANGDVSFEDPGWLANRTQLPLSYQEGYASRFVDQSCWYRIDAVNAQVEDLVRRWPTLIVSGDVAADAVLPWKVPSVGIVYGETEDAAMDDLGFVRADTPATASVLVRPVPDERFADELVVHRSMRIAPLLHLVADLVELGGDDRLEAARRFEDLEP